MFRSWRAGKLSQLGTIFGSPRRPWELRVLNRSLCILSLGFIVGCNQGPARVAAPDWDPDGFADAIVAKLDGNSDGSLDKSELSGAPGLAWGAKYIDTDKNQTLSRDELVARFTLYRDMRLGLTTKQMQLTYKGRPLPGAKVTLLPEFFLDGIVEPASGEVFEDGTVDPRVPNLDPSGMRVGYYRIVVESPRVKIPAKYGSAETTTLGVEVSPVSEDQASYGTIKLLLQGE